MKTYDIYTCRTQIKTQLKTFMNKSKHFKKNHTGASPRAILAFVDI